MLLKQQNKFLSHIGGWNRNVKKTTQMLEVGFKCSFWNSKFCSNSNSIKYRSIVVFTKIWNEHLCKFWSIVKKNIKIILKGCLSCLINFKFKKVNFLNQFTNLLFQSNQFFTFYLLLTCDKYYKYFRTRKFHTIWFRQETRIDNSLNSHLKWLLSYNERLISRISLYMNFLPKSTFESFWILKFFNHKILLLDNIG